MKKFFAIALCAFMMVAMIASVSATDYVFEYDFEDDVEGDWIAIDNSLKTYPKQFSIQVVKFDGDMCMKFDRTGYVEGAGDKDCFSDMFIGGTQTSWGLYPRFVFSYDVYFEKLTTSEASSSCWQVGMLRMAAPAGTQFQQSFSVIGNQLVENAKADAPLMEIKEGKWYNFAVAFDMENKCFSMYVDGDLVCEDLDWDCSDTSASEATQIRLAWNASTGDYSADGVAYVDNWKVYLADKPENATGKTVETSAPVTEAPATEAPATEAPATGA
ncbi:MAG: hypothetical protein ACI3XP_02390, partial [Eubacteriales bacterium]